MAFLVFSANDSNEVEAAMPELACSRSALSFGSRTSAQAHLKKMKLYITLDHTSYAGLTVFLDFIAGSMVC